MSIGPPDQYREKLYIAHRYAFGSVYILDIDVVSSSNVSNGAHPFPINWLFDPKVYGSDQQCNSYACHLILKA